MSTAIQWTDVTDNIIVAEQGGWYWATLKNPIDNTQLLGIMPV
jgi:hypothetical protein